MKQRLVLALVSLFAAIGCSSNSTTGSGQTASNPFALTLRVQNAAGSALSLTPTVVEGASATFSGNGGNAPYQYSIAGCDSTINLQTGLFVAANDVSTCQIVVTDSNGSSANLTVNVTAVNSATPVLVSQTLNAGDLLQIPASGGQAPYTFAVSGCDSSIDANTGIFTAAADTSICQVTVTDATGGTASLLINILAAAASPLVVSAPAQIAGGMNLQATASGGTAPYTYMVAGCDSTIDANSGLFTAADDASNCTLQVTDATGAMASAAVEVTAAVAAVTQPLDVSHHRQHVPRGGALQIDASGGTLPYAFAVAGCDSTIDAASGLFTGGLDRSICLVTVTDASGATATEAILVGREHNF